MKISSGIITLALLGCLALQGYAQKVITEFEFEKSKVDKLSGMTFNDSLFLTADLMSMGTPTGKVSYWVRKDGSKRKIDFSKMGARPIFAVSATVEEEYYYYLVESKKEVAIKALVIDKKTGQSKIDSEEIPLAGNIYGSFVEDNDLFLLNAVKGSYTLKLIRIHTLSVVSEQPFSLTFDLGSQAVEKVNLNVAGTEFIPANGVSPIKITKEKESIWISIDEPRGQYDRTEMGKSLYKTTVMKLDLNNPNATIVKSFFETTPSYFSSVIFNGILFRVYSDSYYHFDAFDIASGQKIFSRSFTRKNQFNEAANYVRSEESHSIKKIITTTPFKILNLNFINIDTVSSNDYILTAGEYGITTPSTPLIHNFGLVGLLVSAATQAAVKELSEGQMWYAYCHWQLNIDGRFNHMSKSGLLTQKIDDYELENFKEKMEYKGYLASVGSVYAFYNVTKSNTIKVVEFKR